MPRLTCIQDSDSDSDSDSDKSSSSPVKARPRAKADKSPPHLDLNAVSRIRQRSLKQKENDNNAVAAKGAEIVALKLKMKTLTKKHEKTKADLRDRDAMDTPPESEEEEEIEMSSFSRSIISKGVVASTTMNSAPKKLRKSGETPIATPMSRVPLTEIGDDSNAVNGRDTPGTGAGGVGETSPPFRSPLKRKRVHGSPPPPTRSSSSSSRRPHKRAKVVKELQKAEFVAGKAPSGSHTNLKDYTEPARKLLKSVMHVFEVRVWTYGSYPPVEVQTDWVKEIWDEVCTDTGDRKELTERMSIMIRKYGSHARSTLKDGVRPLIAPTYGFKIGDSDKVVRKNMRLWKALLTESAFHYKDPAELTGYAGNSIIVESMRAIWFKGKGSRGILYEKYFSPISLVTLALIFTAGTFDEVLNKERYEVHLQDLTEWASLKPSVTGAIRQRMHDTLRSATGTALVKTAGRLTDAGRARALQELEAMDVDEAADTNAEAEAATADANADDEADDDADADAPGT
ncbi:hypothetical protein DFH07DRAFT_968538 [Mycena maculata]|uniref:DUF6532 domain-containing protein n=1 Tax=Mycena maculata TaxID=230809 RepID=A0AAD7I085_9AGAR|nr:hypothetical protein DFH07DRAFT_968538 [Mycena maculata]